jgi:hypothetical protein
VRFFAPLHRTNQDIVIIADSVSTSVEIIVVSKRGNRQSTTIVFQTL